MRLVYHFFRKKTLANSNESILAYWLWEFNLRDAQYSFKYSFLVDLLRSVMIIFESMHFLLHRSGKLIEAREWKQNNPIWNERWRTNNGIRILREKKNIIRTDLIRQSKVFEPHALCHNRCWMMVKWERRKNGQSFLLRKNENHYYFKSFLSVILPKLILMMITLIIMIEDISRPSSSRRISQSNIKNPSWSLSMREKKICFQHFSFIIV